jgi:hypothetical protein
VLFNPSVSIPETSTACRRLPNPPAPHGLPIRNLLAFSNLHIKWSQSSGLSQLAIFPHRPSSSRVSPLHPRALPNDTAIDHCNPHYVAHPLKLVGGYSHAKSAPSGRSTSITAEAGRAQRRVDVSGERIELRSRNVSGRR